MHSLNHASAALIFLVFATSASASVVTLNYTSGSNGVFEQNGLITIDESLYPGGSVNGTTLSIQIVAFAGASSSLINRATYGVFGAASGSGTLDTYTGNVESLADFILAAEGEMQTVTSIPPIPGQANELTLRFDQTGNVVSWRGVYIQGNAIDYVFTETGFSNGFLETGPAGSWTRDPATVPLPAGLPMLMISTAELIGLRRKTRSHTAVREAVYT